MNLKIVSKSNYFHSFVSHYTQNGKARYLQYKSLMSASDFLLLSQILLLDVITHNTDRHMRNFDMIFGARKRLAPCFDNEAGLFSRDSLNALRHAVISGVVPVKDNSYFPFGRF